MSGRQARQASQSTPIDFENIAKHFHRRRRKLSAKKLLGTSAIPQPRAQAKITRVEDRTLSYKSAISESVRNIDLSSRNLAPTESRPTFTYGYSRSAIHPRLLDLQNNIGSDKTPYMPDLSILSEPISDCFWPFLVIIIHETAYAQATASPEPQLAVAARACSGAIHELAALSHLRKHRSPRNLKSQNSFEAAQSFSLCIEETLAVLKTYVMREDGSIVEFEMQSFNLREAADLEDLRAQLESILYWAWKVRLPIIIELLGRIMHHMHGQTSGETFSWPNSESRREEDLEERNAKDCVPRQTGQAAYSEPPVLGLWERISSWSVWMPCLGRPKHAAKQAEEPIEKRIPLARDSSLAFRSPELE